MSSEHFSMFLLGHTWRLIPGILFLDYGVNTSSVLLDTSAVRSKLLVTICELLIRTLLNTGHYQVFAFSQCDRAGMASPGCCLWVHMGMSRTMQFSCLVSWCLPFHFAGNVFLFLHLATSIFPSWLKSRVSPKPLVAHLLQMHFAAFSFFFLFCSLYILTRIIFMSVTWNNCWVPLSFSKGTQFGQWISGGLNVNSIGAFTAGHWHPAFVLFFPLATLRSPRPLISSSKGPDFQQSLCKGLFHPATPLTWRMVFSHSCLILFEWGLPWPKPSFLPGRSAKTPTCAAVFSRFFISTLPRGRHREVNN